MAATEAIDRLLEWATAQGVVLNGIAPRPLAGHGGTGMVATRAIEAGELVLTVPNRLLRSLGSTPRPVVRRLRGASVHALLAAALCLDASPELAIWRAVLPTRAAVAASTPLCWPAEPRRLLPPAAAALLARQQAKFDADWARVAAAYDGDGIDRAAFIHAWVLVNSRTFYHTTPRTERRLPKDDHMALQPVADLFNHGPEGGCAVAFDRAGYTFTASRAYRPGDELLICYGRHPDDFLLVEYGFVLGGAENNRWDEACLDPYLCPAFSPAQRRRLEEAGFWARYALDADTACYRTLTALRLLCLPPARWRAVVNGARDEDLDRAAVDAELRQVLRRAEGDARARLADVDGLGDGCAQARACLRARWSAIERLVVAAIARLETGTETEGGAAAARKTRVAAAGEQDLL